MDIKDFLLARITEDEAEAVTADFTIRQEARMFRECRAKRAIIEEHGPEEVASLDRATWAKLFIVCRCCARGPRQVVAPCPTLKSLAAVYSDHADYQQDWAA